MDARNMENISDSSKQPWGTVNSSDPSLKMQSGSSSFSSAPDIYTCCRNGDSAALSRLFSSGQIIDVNKADEKGETPLFLAASNGNQEMMQTLLSHGAQVDAADKYGWTPLITASHYGKDDTVRYLLSQGASVRRADKFGNTPLHHAAAGGHTSTCGLLLQKGANEKALNCEQKTPVQMASESGHVGCISILRPGDRLASDAINQQHHQIAQMIDSRMPRNPQPEINVQSQPQQPILAPEVLSRKLTSDQECYYAPPAAPTESRPAQAPIVAPFPLANAPSESEPRNAAVKPLDAPAPGAQPVPAIVAPVVVPVAQPMQVCERPANESKSQVVAADHFVSKGSVTPTGATAMAERPSEAVPLAAASGSAIVAADKFVSKGSVTPKGATAMAERPKEFEGIVPTSGASVIVAADKVVSKGSVTPTNASAMAERPAEDDTALQSASAAPMECECIPEDIVADTEINKGSYVPLGGIRVPQEGDEDYVPMTPTPKAEWNENKLHADAPSFFPLGQQQDLQPENLSSAVGSTTLSEPIVESFVAVGPSNTKVKVDRITQHGTLPGRDDITVTKRLELLQSDDKGVDISREILVAESKDKDVNIVKETETIISLEDDSQVKLERSAIVAPQRNVQIIKERETTIDDAGRQLNKDTTHIAAPDRNLEYVQRQSIAVDPNEVLREVLSGNGQSSSLDSTRRDAA